jgi:hypothetical protein
MPRPYYRLSFAGSKSLHSQFTGNEESSIRKFIPLQILGGILPFLCSQKFFTSRLTKKERLEIQLDNAMTWFCIGRTNSIHLLQTLQ